MAHRQQLIELVEDAFGAYGPEELLAKLTEAGVPAGKVRSLDEVHTWEQVRSQGLLVEVEHPQLGCVTLPGPPLRFFAPDATEITKASHQAPPQLDADGEAIRRWVAKPKSAGKVA